MNGFKIYFIIIPYFPRLNNCICGLTRGRDCNEIVKKAEHGSSPHPACVLYFDYA